MKKRHYEELAFEDSLNDDWSHDLSAAEVPLGNRPLVYLGIAAAAAALAVAGQVIYLNANGAYYRARAADNIAQYTEIPAPRGVIYDSEGDVLAESKAAFAAALNVNAYVRASPGLQAATAATLSRTFGISSADLASRVSAAAAADFATPVVIADNLSPSELVALQAADLPTIAIERDFVRSYPMGPVFSSVVGYTGRVTAADLAAHPSLTASDFVGKAGIEAFYDRTLRGTPGIDMHYENAFGKILAEGKQTAPQAGGAIHLTIDGGLQEELYTAVKQGLASLGRKVGLGLAMDPRTGKILALVNLPGYDNNAFSQSGAAAATEIGNLLTSPERPLFNRIVNGVYNPGSTIKPVDAVGALADGVVTPQRTMFSPGYLLVPDPYNSSTPTRYADWRYQGTVDLASALAQSSDVYFYIVGGGSPPRTTPLLNDPRDYGVNGLGPAGLDKWWQTFGLGKPTGIDLPDEAAGFLPTPAWKKQREGKPWLLGDTYNVAIGQGSLTLTPLQILDYISAIANGGTIWRPYLNADSTPAVNENLLQYAQEIKAVQQGMVEGVSSPLGTSYTLHNLPLSVCAKTGSAQVKFNTEENALFVGYAPCDNPKIALLILIENSKQGSLNAVPIAGKVLNWYYWNRIAASPASSTAPANPNHP